MGVNEAAASPQERPAAIRVDIGELVFDGFGRLDADRVRDSFQRELTRLLTERGIPLGLDGDRAAELLAGLPELPATNSPRRLGEALARAIHAGLSGSGAPGRDRRRRP
jgi:hypothetical protein